MVYVWRGLYHTDLQDKPQPAMAEGAPTVSADGKTDQFVQRQRGVRDVDQHVHKELAAHNALLDVLDVDFLLSEVGADPGDDALLVASEDADDGKDTVH